MSRRQRIRRRTRHQGKRRSPVLFAAGVVTMAFVIGVLAVLGWIASVASSTPPLSSLTPRQEGAISQVYAADGSKLGTIQADTLRVPVPGSQIPTVMRDATIAIEDQRFYHHGAVDYPGLLRAAFVDLTGGSTAQGGSTITMQLTRALYLNDAKTITRKIREASLAQQLESRHSKAWILNTYLNDIPYGTVGGQTAVGVEAASRMFFNKDASQLSVPQAALLAGLPQAPSDYNPFLDPQAATDRRDEVIQKMESLHMISSTTEARALADPLEIHQNNYFQAEREQYFFDYVREELIAKYGVTTVTEGGLKVYTTIDPQLQQLARASIARNLDQSGDPSSAVVSIDPSDGYIRTMAASEIYGTGKGQTTFNYAADAHRQPGSVFKLFILLAALRDGVDPFTTYYDSHHLDIQDPIYGHIVVSTDTNTYSGRINLIEATVQSDNTVYEQLDLDVGPPAVTKAARDAGITTDLHNYPAEGLGGLTHGTTPLEIADAYATVASGGWRNKPIAITKVVFPDGRVDSSWGVPQRTKEFPTSITYVATEALEANIQRGTGTAANMSGCPDAGKTGTTSSYKDAWFAGFTPKLSTAVWVGYTPDAIPMTDVQGITVFGGTFPAQIWHDYMTSAVGSGSCPAFVDPGVTPDYQPFFGHYMISGGGGSGPSSNGSNPSSTTTTTNTSSTTNPKLYQSPPQGPPHIPTPATGGNGGGSTHTGTGTGHSGTGANQGGGGPGASGGGATPTAGTGKHG